MRPDHVERLFSGFVVLTWRSPTAELIDMFHMAVDLRLPIDGIDGTPEFVPLAVDINVDRVEATFGARLPPSFFVHRTLKVKGRVV